ncbi:MAG: glycosyltransferase family 2 protein [Pyrinomonadaceae bacterium]
MFRDSAARLKVPGESPSLRLSVAMCTCNGALYIREQLESIVAQRQPPNELIICDDKSDDETQEIVRSFISNVSFPVRLYVNESRLGVIRNFERAINLCDGDIIALSDQDDVWAANKLERIKEHFAAAPETGLVLTDAEVVDKDLRPLGYKLWQSVFSHREQKRFKAGGAFDVLLRRNIATGATMAFRSKFKELVLPVPTDLTIIHDGWIATVIAAVALVKLIDEPLIKYRQHSGQQIGVSPRSAPDAVLQAFFNTRATAASSKASFLNDIYRLKKIRTRLLSHGHDFAIARAVRQLEAITTHLEARASMPAGKLTRVPLVLQELLTLRYHRYSKGIRSALRDLSVTDSPP